MQQITEVRSNLKKKKNNDIFLNLNNIISNFINQFFSEEKYLKQFFTRIKAVLCLHYMCKLIRKNKLFAFILHIGAAFCLQITINSFERFMDGIVINNNKLQVCTRT